MSPIISINILFFFIMMIISLLNHSSNAAEQDFCVTDLRAQEGPAGYPCKDTSKVTSDDFYLNNITRSRTSLPLFNHSRTVAFTPQFPGLNGLGVSLLYFQIEVGGFVPIHAHPRASEVVYVIEGTVYVGFISSDNKAFYKTLLAGDVFIFPQGLLHFLVNSGRKSPARILASYGGSNPGIQVFTTSIAGNDLPSDIVAKVTLISNDQVKKLKAQFGGKN